MKKKIKLHSESVYFLALLIMSFSVAMVAAANLGVSMIVAPAYILSCKFSFLTFGQSEYVVQTILFVIFCIIMKKVKIIYFSSYITGIIYGFMLDIWIMLIPMFNSDVTEPGSMSMPLRILFYALGTIMTALSVALFFRTYIYPMVYDFFVKGVTQRFNIKLSKFKTCYDATFLITACILTLVFFKKFVGVGVGTIITTCINGTLIGFFNKFLDKHLEVIPFLPKFAKKFEL